MDYDLFNGCMETFLCIGNSGKDTIVEICKETNKIYLTINKHKQFLLDKDLVKIVPSKKDKRKQIIKLTKKGSYCLNLVNSFLNEIKKEEGNKDEKN